MHLVITQAEIYQLEVSFLTGYDDVLWLQIIVDDVPFMKVSDGGEQLEQYLFPGFCSRLALKEFVEILTIHIFHYKAWADFGDMRAPRHFSALSFDIEEAVKGAYLSETTLQRLWLYKSGYSTTAIHTLNVLCQYIGISDWETFCGQLNESSEDESEMDERSGIDVDSLKVGTKIRIGWLPDRLCVIKYLGSYRFASLKMSGLRWQ